MNEGRCTEDFCLQFIVHRPYFNVTLAPLPREGEFAAIRAVAIQEA
jgi:hypothetical protein